jgi:hypothetical protein
MKIHTEVKAGRLVYKHNQNLVCAVRIRTGLKAGGIHLNHNQNRVRPTRA